MVNDYITLDGKKYRVPSKTWEPSINKPETVRVTLSGALDLTYGPSVFKEWIGSIEAPVTPIDSSWGSVADVRTSLAKKSSVTFVDHYGTSYTVAVSGPFRERSISPKWDASTNVILFDVRIISVL